MFTHILSSRQANLRWLKSTSSPPWGEAESARKRGTG